MWYLAYEVGVGQVEVGELGEPLEPDGRELRLIEAVEGEVQVPQGGELKKRRVEASALQPAFSEVEGGDAAIGGGTGDTLPVAAVRADPPRREDACGVGGGGEGTPQPEQCRGLVRPARNGCCWCGSLVAGGGEGVGELDPEAQVKEQAQQELLLVAATGDHHIENLRLIPLVAHALYIYRTTRAQATLVPIV